MARWPFGTSAAVEEAALFATVNEDWRRTCLECIIRGIRVAIVFDWSIPLDKQGKGVNDVMEVSYMSEGFEACAAFRLTDMLIYTWSMAKALLRWSIFPASQIAPNAAHVPKGYLAVYVGESQKKRCTETIIPAFEIFHLLYLLHSCNGEKMLLAHFKLVGAQRIRVNDGFGDLVIEPGAKQGSPHRNQATVAQVANAAVKVDSDSTHP
ncbi:hypothetical protein RHSIM_Rhsim05G0064800 [Rhododendron simsii]|uniref:Uncharacterized protein n=1 Tax=Rhododendron simsii TaxID=118357 RepID=A0A834GXE4_RHOSS|nr:hypothetical protein RHSIM_Rhsim05G0064800 [Rhododendron simsii]